MARLQAAPAQPPPPRLAAPVNDFAEVIDPESEAQLERLIGALQQASGDVVVIATVKTFQPYADIREYLVRMFENHGEGVGDRGKDNGLLILVAVDDRQVGIEVGYGLEGFITDGFAGQTIRESLRPSFRRGEYGKGLIHGTTRIISRIAEARGVTLEEVTRQPSLPANPRVELPCGTIFLIIVFLLLLMMGGTRPRRGRRRRRYWGGGPWSGWDSGVGPFGGFGGVPGGFGGGFGGFGSRGGGGFGGGFGGFGGGRSGGGGAAGGW